jgi:hypothetical protein
MIYNQTMNTRNRLQQVALIFFLTALVGCNTPSSGSDSIEATQPATEVIVESPTAEEISSQDWMVIPKEKAEEKGFGSWLVEGDGFWTPSEEDILTLEKALPEFLSQNPTGFFSQPPAWERLEEYQRQYVGFMRDGSRLIYGNYFCKNFGIDWRQNIVMVDDGGDCYFQVEYDLDQGIFIMLMVNGVS